MKIHAWAAGYAEDSLFSSSVRKNRLVRHWPPKSRFCDYRAARVRRCEIIGPAIPEALRRPWVLALAGRTCRAGVAKRECQAVVNRGARRGLHLQKLYECPHDGLGATRVSGGYPHLRLSRWPFPVVPDPPFCTFLAARGQLKQDVKSLVQSLARRDTSSIHIFWAWFGAGKTHTLHYLSHQARTASEQGGYNALYPVYTEFPKGTRSFAELYRAFIFALDVDDIIDAFLQASTAPSADAFQRRAERQSMDFWVALQILCTGEPRQQQVATRWLRADPVPLPALRQIGVAQRIESAEQATTVLSLLVEMLNVAAQTQGWPGARVIWLLDEFQRIQGAAVRGIEAINAGLHSTFNACPTGLSLVFSFSGTPHASGLPAWFSPELRDRIGRTRPMVMPPMSMDEARLFVKEVLAHFRNGSAPGGNELFPFTDASCKLIVERVRSDAELKPRALMQAFDAVLDAAEPLLERGELQQIEPGFAKDVLKEYQVVGPEKAG